MPRPAAWQCLLALLGWLLCATLPALAQEEAAETGNWAERILGRFFGRKVLPGDQLGGTGQPVVGPYLPYAGRRIEVVIVHQVKNFEAGWDADRKGAERLLNSLSRPLHDYTRETVIRQYLLFERGDEVVPFDLADSERLLRNLPFIHDARLIVVPLVGEDEAVAVVVETNDRWPFGGTATVIDTDDWRARLYTTNLLGLGTLFSHQVLRRADGRPAWGYEGRLEQANLGGSFLGAKVLYEDSYLRSWRRLGLERPLVHPGLVVIGGVTWEDFDERDQMTDQNGYHQVDAWTGRVLPLYDHRDAGVRRRTMLVPAVRFVQRDYYHRPAVAPDSSCAYHDRRQYMASVTWLSKTPFKTSYLYADGEIEDVSAGTSVRLTGFWEDGEYRDQPGFYLDAQRLALQERGDLTRLGVSLGGYIRGGNVVNGALELHGSYISPLIQSGAYRHRFYSNLDYTTDLGRCAADRIYLDDRSGVSHLENEKVAGTRRLVLQGRYRLFTPHSVLGFRMGFFGFGDVGFIGGPGGVHTNTRVRGSVGLGVRMRNPKLVLPTFQVHVFVVSEPSGNDFRVGLDLGSAEGPPREDDDVRPQTLVYE